MQPWREGCLNTSGGKKYENIYFALDNHWYLISSLNLHADVKICLCIHALAILLTNNQK